MTTALLGDPASMSALGAALRRSAVQLGEDGEQISRALSDAEQGWRGPRALLLRRRAATTAEQTRVVAAALDAIGRSLQTTATDVSAQLARLRGIEAAAGARGLEVRDGTVMWAWGITGVADAVTVQDECSERERLQEQVHQVVSALGRHRAGLARDLARASDLLARASTALRD